jgi:hypothetical protein
MAWLISKLAWSFVHDCSKPYGEFDYVNVYEILYEFVCCIMKEGKCMVEWTTFGIIFVVFFAVGVIAIAYIRLCQ